MINSYRGLITFKNCKSHKFVNFTVRNLTGLTLSIMCVGTTKKKISID